MKDNSASKTGSRRISWPRRLKNHWVSHNQNTLHLSLGAFFAGLFAVGALLRSKSGMEASLLPGRLKTMGFGGLLLVLLLVFLHMNLHGTDRFLHHFRDTGNLPTGQMRQVSFFCMILFLTAALLCMAGAAAALPALWTAFTSLFSERSDIASPEADALLFPESPADTPDLSALTEKAGSTPSWLPVLEFLMTLAALLIIAALVCLLLYNLAHRLYSFLLRRREWDDDEKVFLKPTLIPLASPKEPSASKTSKRKLSFSRPSSFRDEIRREYRRTIRTGMKKQKNHPAPWAAPAELEASAGCSDHVLHRIYEKARYAPDPCTREDLDAVRRSKASRHDPT